MSQLFRGVTSLAHVAKKSFKDVKIGGDYRDRSEAIRAYERSATKVEHP